MAELADGVLEARLDTVKRGFDPHQVKRLVSTLATELKELDAENTALKQELELAKLSSSATATRATEDIVNSWTRETSEMLDGARQHVTRIMEKANADAASVVAAAEGDAAEIRQRAQAEADATLADASARSAELVRDAEQQRESELASVERRSAEIVAAAEGRAAATTREAEQRTIALQAEVDQAAAELARVRDQITELERERQSIREQFVNTQVYLQGLVALIEPSPDRAARTLGS